MGLEKRSIASYTMKYGTVFVKKVVLRTINGNEQLKRIIKREKLAEEKDKIPYIIFKKKMTRELLFFTIVPCKPASSRLPLY